MNRIHRVLWNAAKGCWTAVSEKTGLHQTRGRRTAIAAAVLAAAFAAAEASAASIENGVLTSNGSTVIITAGEKPGNVEGDVLAAETPKLTSPGSVGTIHITGGSSLQLEGNLGKAFSKTNLYVWGASTGEKADLLIGASGSFQEIDVGTFANNSAYSTDAGSLVISGAKVSIGTLDASAIRSGESRGVVIESGASVDVKNIALGGYLENNSSLTADSLYRFGDDQHEADLVNNGTLVVSRSANIGALQNAKNAASTFTTLTLTGGQKDEAGTKVLRQSVNEGFIEVKGMLTLSGWQSTSSFGMLENQGEMTIQTAEINGSLTNAAGSTLTTENLTLAVSDTGKDRPDIYQTEILNSGTLKVTGKLAASSGTRLVNEAGGVMSAKALSLNGTELMTKGELSAEIAEITNGVLNVAGGTLTAGSLVFDSGDASSNRLVIAAGAEASIAEGSGSEKFSVASNTAVELAGTLSTKSLFNNGRINSESSELAGVLKAAELTNYGTIRIETATADVFENYRGLGEDQVGIAQFGALTSSQGSMGGTVEAGSFHLEAPQDLYNAMTVDGEFSAETAEIDASATLKVTDGTTRIDSLTLAGMLNVGAATVDVGTMTFKGGTVVCTSEDSAGLTVDTIQAVGEGVIYGDGKVQVGAFQNSGSFTLSQAEMTVGTLDLSNGQLLLSNQAGIVTDSSQIFALALNDEGSNPDPYGLRWNESQLSFENGSRLTINDAKYNESYAASAGDLLSGVALAFTGEMVDASGEVVTEVGLGEVADVTLAEVTLTAKPSESGSSTVTVDKTVGGKNLDVGESTGVDIQKDSTLTLVGEAAGDGDPIELIDFAGESGTHTVTVGGSLALGLSDVEALKGQISADVALGEGSSLTSENGDFALKKVTAESGAQIEVRSGTLSVDELAFTADEEQEKTSTIRSAEGAAIAVEALNAASPNHTLQFEGNVSAKTLSGEGTLLVGSESAAATVAVNELSHSGVIFIDPAWTDNAQMQDGSFLTVSQLGTDGTLNAKVIAGQNSSFVFGADKSVAVTAFADTNLSYGKDGITAVLYVAKPITVGSTGAILVDGALEALGSTTPEGGSVTIAENGLAMIDAAALSTPNTAAVTAETIAFEKGAQVRISNLKGDMTDAVLFKATGTLTVAEGMTFESSDAMLDVKLEAKDNQLVYTTDTKDADDVFAGFAGSSLMQAVYDQGANNTESADRTAAFLSRMASYKDYGVGSAGEAAAAGNQSMALAAASGVYNVALDASKLMNRTIDRRMTLKDGMTRPQSAAGATVWADVMATTNEAKSLYGHSGYSVDLYGAVLGADVEVGQGKAIGAAFTVGAGDGETKDAAMRVDSDADFVGFSLYGSHQMGSFMGKIDAGYMHTKSDLSARAFGMSVGGEISADAWTVGIGGEYRFDIGSFGITPHVGIRWTRLDVDGYDGVFRTESDAMNIWTAPIGVAFSGQIHAGGWKLAPFVDLSVVPSFGDDEAASRVRWGDASAAIRTKVVDDAPFQAALGLSAECGSWTLGASYDLGIGGDDRLDNAFTLKARYAF